MNELILTDEWPKAVPQQMICDTSNEDNKVERGKGIVELLLANKILNKKFLDFGCGEGHIVKAAQDTSFKMGYDIVKEGKLWGELNLTTDFEEVKKHAPFDVIMLYDVMDHVEESLVIDVVEKVRSICSPRTKVFARFHPWSSRHGGHCYQKLNKAYAHHFLEDEDYKELDIEKPIGQKILYDPVSTYKAQWAGFRVVHKHNLLRKVEKFFDQFDNDFSNIEFVDFVMQVGDEKNTAIPML